MRFGALRQISLNKLMQYFDRCAALEEWVDFVLVYDPQISCVVWRAVIYWLIYGLIYWWIAGCFWQIRA